MVVVLAMVLVVLAVRAASHKAGLPDAVLLTLAGLVYAVLPGPNLRLDPEIVLNIVLPPLLYHAALSSSLQAIRGRMRSVMSLSVLLVLATALVVGGLLTWLVPAIPFAAAVALGAAIAPAASSRWRPPSRSRSPATPVPPSRPAARCCSTRTCSSWSRWWGTASPSGRCCAA